VSAPADGAGSGTAPSGSACAKAVGGTSGTASLTSSCGGPSQTVAGGGSQANTATSRATAPGALLGFGALPSTATAAVEVGFLGAVLAAAGLMLLRKQRS
jgi:hypothetical protein